MIVVINPSGSAGRSFKGLHAYCAHDQQRAQTSDRVDWIDTRNVAADDPAQAWKIMAATAAAQNDLKKAASVRAGRASKDGAVMHVVLSFDEDEPADRETMQAAADDFLSQLGADPAKMRGKSKPKRRQFADEHQVVMYAHRDTDNAHLHMMINTVHPEHGVKLPTSNNQIKAQKWALEFSKQHGTDMKTPAREENADARDSGDYVKGEKRKSRNAYEQEQAAKAANDNKRLQSIIEEQRKKDAALALRGRNLKAMQDRAWQVLTDAHKERKAALARSHQRDMNKIKADVREEFRPEWRELRKHQQAERQTFEELERSFFGRASNMAKVARLSADDLGEGKSNIIKRTFKVVTNASERKAYFEAAQERARKAVQREQSEKLAEAAKSLKATHEAKLANNRAVLIAERDQLKQKQDVERVQLKDAWRVRTAERAAAMDELAAKATASRKLQNSHAAARKKDSGISSELEEAYAEIIKARIAKQKAKEQDNKLDRDWDMTDDD